MTTWPLCQVCGRSIVVHRTTIAGTAHCENGQDASFTLTQVVEARDGMGMKVGKRARWTALRETATETRTRSGPPAVDGSSLPGAGP